MRSGAGMDDPLDIRALQLVTIRNFLSIKRFFLKSRDWYASGKTQGEEAEIPYLYKSIAP